MVRRLILGSGTTARAVATALDEASGSVAVLTEDETLAEELRDNGVSVEVGTETDPAALGQFGEPDVIAAADDDGEANLGAALAAEDVFGASRIVAYTGLDGAEVDADLETVADTVIDPEGIVTETVMGRAGDDGIRFRHLAGVLRSIDTLAIVTHDNPDPDAIASAIALGRVATRFDCESEVCYFGDITHQENRAFVNLLDFDLRNLDDDEELEGFDGVALVDHSRPGVNDGLAPDTPVDVVIDHHPPRAPVEARFVDLRSEVGATSTLMVEYLEFFDLELTEDVATGLLFGIRVDTQEFRREVCAADFEAAATLVARADSGLLERIESPSVSPETFETIASAIRNRHPHGPILMSCVGHLSDRDALAQAADRLLTMEDVTTTVVFGLLDDTIYVSARALGGEVDLGETLRDAFDQIGSAGGHADMAGAQITLGVLEAVEDREESLLEIVESVVCDRFIDAFEARAAQTVAGVYDPEFDAVDEYLVPEGEEPAAEDDEAGGEAVGDDGEAGSEAAGDDPSDGAA